MLQKLQDESELALEKIQLNQDVCTDFYNDFYSSNEFKHRAHYSTCRKEEVELQRLHARFQFNEAGWVNENIMVAPHAYYAKKAGSLEPGLNPLYPMDYEEGVTFCCRK